MACRCIRDKEIHQTNRPILVGTTSVEKSEVLSNLLQNYDIPHNLLNAKPENVERESEIIAQAGRLGAVTISTNMAGRGTDIILGGNSDYMSRLKLRETLIGVLLNPEENIPSLLKSKHPNAIGFSDKEMSTITSLPLKVTLYPCELSDDSNQCLKDLSKELADAWGFQSLTLVELEERIATAAEKAPTLDPQIQSLRFAINTVKSEFDVVISEEERQVRQAGGLHVIGTERHESRRVDNQLRGEQAVKVILALRVFSCH